MKKKTFILLFVFSLLLILIIYICFHLTQSSVEKSTCKDCNVILISLDTLSANHLPCYGYERNTAPNLCKFGKENIMFKNMFSNANYTLPSHVSIFTGLYPNQHKIYDAGSDYLPPGVPFLPEILQKDGYKTYFYMPSNDLHLPIKDVYYRGIDSITDAYHPKKDWIDGLGKLKSNNEEGQKTFLFLHTYWVHSPYLLENIQRTIYAKDMDTFNYPKTKEEMMVCTKDFLKYLTRILKRVLKSDIYKNNAKLYSAYNSMHKELNALFQEHNEMEFCTKNVNNKLLPNYYGEYHSSLIDTNNKEIMNHLKDLYDSKIVELDEYLKGVFSFVQESELKKNTIIIVTADHGEEFMEHGRKGHGGNLYDTSLKIPLIMYIPGQKSKTVIRPVQSVDIVPTILNLLNIKNTYTFSGADLFGSKTNRYVVAQHSDGVSVIRDEQWKLFYRMNNNKPIGFMLFDYKNDPQEKNNVIFTHTDIVERLLNNIPR